MKKSSRNDTQPSAGLRQIKLLQEHAGAEALREVQAAVCREAFEKEKEWTEPARTRTTRTAAPTPARSSKKQTRRHTAQPRSALLDLGLSLD